MEMYEYLDKLGALLLAVVSGKENEYGGLIEYKNKKDLEKDDAASEIVSKIKTKLRNSSEKIFL
jgi:hypothetical protein